jgi:peptidoglycan/LPS O-acetylase OafA/YrhL
VGSVFVKKLAVVRVASLDALRALAVVGVLVYHLGELTPAFRFLPPNLSWLTLCGSFGVDLFYVLSGFFIGSAVLRPAEWSPAKFMAQRARRILPAYYFSLLMLGGASLYSVQRLIDILMHLGMMHAFLPWTHGSINGVYWTLGVEFPFYILMLALAPFYRDNRHRLIVCLGLIAFAILWRAGVYYSGEQNPWMRFFLSSQLPGALDSFGFGCLVAAFFQCRPNIKLAPINAWLGAISGSIVLALCFMYYRRHIGDYWFDFFSSIFWRTALSTGFAMILFSLAVGGKNRLIDSISSWSGLAYLGKISFSVYLWHMPIIIFFNQYSVIAGFDLDVYGVPLILIATLFFSSASYYFIERRWHRS